LRSRFEVENSLVNESIRAALSANTSGSFSTADVGGRRLTRFRRRADGRRHKQEQAKQRVTDRVTLKSVRLPSSIVLVLCFE
jgi:hypothetical protein